MRSVWFRRLGLAAVAGLAIAGSSITTTGCAGTREDINRVQPNAVRKNDLVGDYRNGKEAPDFYMRSLIVEVQRTNPWVSDGLQDLTRRVRFEITENFLVARNAFEYIQNSDGKGGPKGRTNNGNIVGVWPITSHFNIQRSYNQATGEETNVIEENSTDVPWYEREYMRVDWSVNRITDPNQIFYQERASGEMNLQPVSFFETRPGRADTSNFTEVDKGYFDLTSKWLFKPASFDYYGYQVPYCLLQNMSLYPETYSEGSVECNDQEITLRTSFWKVPTGAESTDYEVAEVTSWEGNIMGNLQLDRSGYDREYGITDQSWHRYIMRYNIWKKSHNDTVCGADNKKDDANAFCNAQTMDSTCDLNVKRCTIPYKDRTIRPLAFYLDPALPKELWPATQRAIGEWNMALSRAVGYAREIECRHAGEARDVCHAKWFDGAIDLKKEDQPKLEDGVVIMCHNPVIEGDNKACGEKGFTTRKGDIRHQMIAWWNNPSFNRPLGVVVWSGDPTTGENIGSTVNIFGASVETYSASARDQLQLISGDFTPAEYAAGLPRQIYSAQNLINSTDPIIDPVLDSYATRLASGVKPAMSQAEVAARLKAVDVAKLQKEFGADTALAEAKTPIDKMSAWVNYVKKQSSLGESGSHFVDPKVYLDKINRRMEGLQKGGLETTVVNDLWTSALGINPKLAGDKTVLDGLSPLRGLNPTQLALAAQADVEKNRAKQMCELSAPEMLSFNWQAGYAAKMKARYPDGATATGEMAKRAGVENQKIDRVVRGKIIYQELLEPMYEFTLLHEMGHLMSMQHDFSGSWDSPNFYPEYWTLRTNAGKASAACTTARAPGSPDTCMGPRWMDPTTPEELGTIKGSEHDSMDAYAVSSVMDYKFDSLYAAKLGLMDKMSAKFIYTRTIELFDDDDKSLIKNSKGTSQRYLPTLTLMNSERWIVGGNYVHYTDMGRQLNLFDPNRCRPQTKEEADKGIGALGLTCAPPHKDHAFVKDMKDALPSGFPEWARVFYAVEKSTADGGFVDAANAKKRWPYKVGDGRTSYVHQFVYDNGADFYEVTQDILERYQLMYLDYFFRKGSRERNIASSAGARMFGRFFDRVQALQWNALSDVVRNGAGIEGGGDPEAQARVLSLTMLFDAMQAAFLRPQPGSYVQDKQIPGLNPVFVSVNDEANKNSPVFNLGAGDARYIDHKFDLTKQFDYQAYMFRAGSFLEKPYAGIALTDARPQLSTVARETYLDGRNVMFSFRSALPQAFDRLVAGVFADDWDTVAPFIDASAKPDSFGMSPMSAVKLWESDVTKLSAARPAGSKVVDPMLGYRVKVPAVVMMLLYQPIDSSMELVNKTRVWVAGSSEAIKVPDAEKMIFFDPVDGVEWNAKSFGKETLTGKIVDTGIGARMLEHANELLVSAYNVETEVANATTGQKRAKYGPDGRPMRVGGGALTAADVKDAVAEKKLRDYVAFLNQVRVALYYLGFGPCGYSYDRDC